MCKYEYLRCYHFNNCVTLRKGKLYTCPLIPYSEHFSKYYKKDLKISENDYIDIHKAKSFDEIAQFCAKRPDFCRYCKVKERSFKKFALSKKSIVEWT